MNYCFCRNCGYEGSEDDFFREDVHDLVGVLQDVFEDGKISEDSFNNLMDVFNTDICPNCGDKEIMICYGGGGTTYYTSDGMVSADEYYSGLEEHEALDQFCKNGIIDANELDQLYADGVIDEDEWWEVWWERKHG